MPGIVPRMLLVYGPRSDTYDFGPGHPLTPRRFGPGHRPAARRRSRAGPGARASAGRRARCGATPGATSTPSSASRPTRSGRSEAGIGEGGDDPPFAGMHEAAAAVAGGSLRAVEAVLRGDVEHAFHPGGGLHHAMPDRASGFCIYDDPALAIARARRDGLRVLYVDLDVHHGDGVQAIHRADPGVLTVSFHESGRVPVPGDGRGGGAGRGGGSRDVGQRAAGAGDRARGRGWRRSAGCSPSWPPRSGRTSSCRSTAPIRTPGTRSRTCASRRPRWARRRGSSTSSRIAMPAVGGWRRAAAGTTSYRVVPRSWSLVWLAGAHREVPAETPGRVAGPLGGRGGPIRPGAAAAGVRRRAECRFRPRCFAGDGRGAIDRGRGARAAARRPAAPAGRAATAAGGTRWRPRSAVAGDRQPTPGVGRPAILAAVDAATWGRLALAPRVIAPADPIAGHALVLAAIRDGAIVSAAVEGTLVVGLAIAGPTDEHARREVLAWASRRPSADAGSRAPCSRHASRQAARATSTTSPRSRSPSATPSSRSSGASGHRSPSGSWCAPGSP